MRSLINHCAIISSSEASPFIPVNDSHFPKGQGRVEKSSHFECKDLERVEDPALRRTKLPGMWVLFSN